MECLIDPTGRTKIPHHTLHTKEGMGVPCYTAKRHELFDATKHMALTEDPDIPKIQMLFETCVTPTHNSQIDSQWMFYEPSNSLTPAQFRMALAVRLDILPSTTPFNGTKCNCGTIYNQHPDQVIEHILRCDQASGKTHTHRHDCVRDAIVQKVRDFGITATREPTCFTYDNGKRQRPDILIHTQPIQIATDLTMIHSEANIADAEKEKSTKHQKACEAANTIFYPLVMKTRGTIGPKGEHFIRATAKFVQPMLQKDFSRQLHHAISTAAARGRADTIYMAVDRMRW